MKRILAGLFCTLVAFATAASAAEPAASDRKLFEKAAVGGMAEVKMAEAAKDQAASAEVKQFAETMIQDHEKANAELEKVAEEGAFEMPMSLDEAHQQKLDALEEKKGPAFDRAYMAENVKAHAKMIKLLERASKAKNEAFAGWAKKTLPKIEEHHGMAERVQKKLGGKASGGSSGKSS